MLVLEQVLSGGWCLWHGEELGVWRRGDVRRDKTVVLLLQLLLYLVVTLGERCLLHHILLLLALLPRVQPGTALDHATILHVAGHLTWRLHLDHVLGRHDRLREEVV